MVEIDAVEVVCHIATRLAIKGVAIAIRHYTATKKGE